MNPDELLMSKMTTISIFNSALSSGQGVNTSKNCFGQWQALVKYLEVSSGPRKIFSRQRLTTITIVTANAHAQIPELSGEKGSLGKESELLLMHWDANNQSCFCVSPTHTMPTPPLRHVPFVTITKPR